MSSLAAPHKLIGFFSYSREDDDDSHGTLSALRDRIQRELCGQLGRSREHCQLWQDKEAIAAGTLWEGAIRTAIGQSVFFIPIITPRAVASPQCQIEFDSFLAREAALERHDLIFPLLYIRVPALENEAQWRDHPVLKVIGARQYVDWRQRRHLDINAPEVKHAIELFCEQIVNALQKPWLPPEERRAREAQAARERAEAEQRAREAEAQRRAEMARQEQEAAARRAEEERRAREAEEQRRATEARKQAEAARQRDEEARRREQAEAQKRIEQRRRAREAEQPQPEEKRRAADLELQDMAKRLEAALAQSRGARGTRGAAQPQPLIDPDATYGDYGYEEPMAAETTPETAPRAPADQRLRRAAVLLIIQGVLQTLTAIAFTSYSKVHYQRDYDTAWPLLVLYVLAASMPLWIGLALWNQGRRARLPSLVICAASLVISILLAVFTISAATRSVEPTVWGAVVWTLHFVTAVTGFGIYFMCLRDLYRQPVEGTEPPAWWRLGVPMLAIGAAALLFPAAAGSSIYVMVMAAIFAAAVSGFLQFQIIHQFWRRPWGLAFAALAIVYVCFAFTNTDFAVIGLLAGGLMRLLLAYRAKPPYQLELWASGGIAVVFAALPFVGLTTFSAITYLAAIDLLCYAGWALLVDRAQRRTT